MPTITVKRLVADGPFHVGDRYNVVTGDTDEHVDGVVSDVIPLDEKSVELVIELHEADYARLPKR